MQKKIGYCINDSFSEDGKPCPKAITKENQLLLNPFTLRCEICDQDLKIEILEDPNKKKKKLIATGKIFGGVLLLAILTFGIFEVISLLTSDNDKPPRVESSDTVPPNPITSLVATGYNKDGSTYVILNWDASTSKDVVYYKVTGKVLGRAKDSLGIVYFGTNIFTDTLVTTGKRYEYMVYAVDSSGNTSYKNSIASVLIPTGNIPPPPPTEPGKVWKTINFPNGDRYVGETKGGSMHGAGEYYFSTRRLISDKDWKNRFAEAGDVLKGSWNEGNFTTGKLYDKNGNHKETIFIGQ